MLRRKKKGSEIPAWVVTFADLMSLLLCFFVLLLSFAEIDVIRFKQLAGQMSEAFGVQRDVPADVIPMGTSAVFDKFSPGKPEMTLREEVRQTTSLERPRLETHKEKERADAQLRLQAMQLNLEQQLQEKIEAGLIHIERDGETVLIRIDEQGSFPSGSADLTGNFSDLLRNLSSTFADAPGTISVLGHTDNVPVRGSRFVSNWDLSAMRSAAVANLLLENAALDPQRLMVVGHAYTRPLMPNDTPRGRAMNRRVEIIVALDDNEDHELFELDAMRLPPTAREGTQTAFAD